MEWSDAGLLIRIVGRRSLRIEIPLKKYHSAPTRFISKQCGKILEAVKMKKELLEIHLVQNGIKPKEKLILAIKAVIDPLLDLAKCILSKVMHKT
nr:unnamed protein product [Callosobruchus chinensis]